MDDERVLHFYKVTKNPLGYIIGFEIVPENNEFDYYGQMGDFPDIIDSFPEGWYLLKENEMICDESRKNEVLVERAAVVGRTDKIEAQTFYTAMMTDTLLDEE